MFSYCHKPNFNLNTCMTQKILDPQKCCTQKLSDSKHLKSEQAGAELGQAHLNLGWTLLYFFVDLVYLDLVWSLACGWIGN